MSAAGRDTPGSVPGGMRTPFWSVLALAFVAGLAIAAFASGPDGATPVQARPVSAVRLPKAAPLRTVAVLPSLRVRRPRAADQTIGARERRTSVRGRERAGAATPRPPATAAPPPAPRQAAPARRLVRR